MPEPPLVLAAGNVDAPIVSVPLYPQVAGKARINQSPLLVDTFHGVKRLLESVVCIVWVKWW